MPIRCPNCQHEHALLESTILDSLRCDACGTPITADSEATIATPDAALSETETLIEGGGSQHQPTGRFAPTLGDYHIVREISRGGMGIVYEAIQTRLDRRVALKVIRSGEFASTSEVQRFQMEAEAAARLEHPGIVPIYDVGESDGQHYFSMGYIEGPSLAAVLRDHPLEPRQSASLIEQVSRAVHYAHSRGIVHRDLKPANVLMDPAGLPKVTDFGLAKRSDVDSHVTRTGEVMGTPSYMPPEQAAGRLNEIGPLSDVYSLGGTLYALLTGRPPFQAANVVETLRQVLEREPIAPRQLNPAIPRDLETITLKCLEKSPAARYGTAEGL
ncbi:MAG: protein kinase, partial [Planctomycetaceae bacterium]|nr:protein kinase [Planctomycetaceae bacterium]